MKKKKNCNNCKINTRKAIIFTAIACSGLYIAGAKSEGRWGKPYIKTNLEMLGETSVLKAPQIPQKMTSAEINNQIEEINKQLKQKIDQRTKAQLRQQRKQLEELKKAQMRSMKFKTRSQQLTD